MRLADPVQPAGALQIVVEDLDARDPLALAHAVENSVDDLAEVVAVLADARGAAVAQRTLVRLCGLEHGDRLLVTPARLEVAYRRLGLEHLVRAGAALGAHDTGSHRSFDHDGVRSRIR